jgi:hypothetical protein
MGPFESAIRSSVCEGDALETPSQSECFWIGRISSEAIVLDNLQIFRDGFIRDGSGHEQGPDQGFLKAKDRKGLVSIRGEKKRAFFVMQEFYRSKQAH